MKDMDSYLVALTLFLFAGLYPEAMEGALKEVQTKMEERAAWKAEILKYLEKGWYKRVLRLMAANIDAGGDVEKMIDGFCAGTAPTGNWREVE